MKRLSGETYELLEQLYKPRSLFDRFMPGQHKPQDLLNRIDQIAGLEVVPHLILYAVRNSNENGVTAARIIHNRSKELSSIELADLDDRIRRTTPDYPQIWGWFDLRVTDIDNVSYLGAYLVSVLGVCSFHNNGFIRERAILELSKCFTGEELPFLLIRLNDWVDGIRATVISAISSRLKPDYSASFVKALPLIIRLRQRKWLSQNPLDNSITQLLQDVAARPVLFASLKSQDRFVRQACYKIAFSLSDLDALAIIDQGSKDQDPQIRLWSVQETRKLGDSSAIKRLLGTFENDGFVLVRREAYRIYISDFPVLAADKIRRALLDPHSSIREEARYYFSTWDKMDFAVFYRNALIQGEVLYPAIRGLGEVGYAADANLIVPYVNHPSKRIRFASLKALSRVNTKDFIDTFKNALFDSSPKVSRMAMNALMLCGHPLSGQQLWALLWKSQYHHTTNNVLALVARLPKWDSIYYLIEASSSCDGQVSVKAKQLIEYWISHFNTSFVQPNEAQRANLSKVLEEKANVLGKSLHNQIEFYVNGF